jgi:hypothetical protein
MGDAEVLDVDSRFWHATAMTSPMTTISSLFSAGAGRCRPEYDGLSRPATTFMERSV